MSEQGEVQRRGRGLRDNGGGDGTNRVTMASIVPEVRSQASAIEIGRAATEVQAMVIVAQANKRVLKDVEAEMVQSMSMPWDVKDAYYRFPRGRTQDPDTGEWKKNYITGMTVHVFRELLRCWGNAEAGVIELRREEGDGEDPGYSEMRAYAWDMEKNSRKVISFISPHEIDRSDDRGGAMVLESNRDIYDHNANVAARRERTVIEQILPKWFVAEAKRTLDTMLAGDPKKLAENLAKSIAAFAEMGVTEAQLVDKLDTPRGAWGALDLAELRVIYSSVKSGATTVGGEFGGGGGNGTGDATLKTAAKQQQQQQERPSRRDTMAQVRALFIKAGYGRNTVEHRQVQAAVAAAMLTARDAARPIEVESLTALNDNQLAQLLHRLTIYLDELADGEDVHAVVGSLADTVLRAQAAGPVNDAGHPTGGKVEDPGPPEPPQDE